MEEIDSSDSDATVNYGVEPPEAGQAPENPRNASQGNDDAIAPPAQLDSVAVPVTMTAISIVQVQEDTQEDTIRPPASAKKRKR